MQIAIASGKGGTGKTTLSASFASFLSEKRDDVMVIDCDVEEPNLNLFLKTDIDEKKEVYSMVPEVDLEKCNGCGNCEKICAFSCFVMIGGEPMIFPDMCHSCYGCLLVCPEKAVIEQKKDIGYLETGKAGAISYRGGSLKIGEAMSPPLIKAVRDFDRSTGLVIVDSPPGTSCPVIEAIKGSDFVILVTEPTPFGLNDLVLAVAVVRQMELSFGVVINRSDLGDNRVVDYCEREGINLLASIPHSKEIAEAYSRGELIETFIEINRELLEEIAVKTGVLGEDAK